MMYVCSFPKHPLLGVRGPLYRKASDVVLCYNYLVGRAGIKNHRSVTLNMWSYVNHTSLVWTLEEDQLNQLVSFNLVSIFFWWGIHKAVVSQSDPIICYYLKAHHKIPPDPKKVHPVSRKLSYYCLHTQFYYSNQLVIDICRV